MNKTPNLPQDGKFDPIRLARVVNEVLRGKSNNLVDVTLKANSGTTTITSPLLGSESHLSFMPRTAHADVDMRVGPLYPSSQGTGYAVISHANNANTDRTFRVTVTGS